MPITPCLSVPHTDENLFQEELIASAKLLAKVFSIKCWACNSSSFEVKTNHRYHFATQTGERQVLK